MIPCGLEKDELAETSVFGWTCDRLESDTSLNRLEARGTVRLALKAAGLKAESVTSAQMAVVVRKVLLGELTSRGIDSAEEKCRVLAASLESEAETLGRGGVETPDTVFSLCSPSDTITSGTRRSLTPCAIDSYTTHTASC